MQEPGIPASCYILTNFQNLFRFVEIHTSFIISGGKVYLSSNWKGYSNSPRRRGGGGNIFNYFYN